MFYHYTKQRTLDFLVNTLLKFIWIWKIIPGGARFNPRSRMWTKPFGVFRGFLRNTRKHGLGFLKKTPLGRHFTYWPRSHKRIIDLNRTTNQRPIHGYNRLLSKFASFFLLSLTHAQQRSKWNFQWIFKFWGLPNPKITF